MSGKWVRNPGATEPAVIVVLLIGVVVIGLVSGAIAVLGWNGLLKPHTPWLTVPGALWSMRHYPIVWKPFLIGAPIGALLAAVLAIGAMFKQQTLHGEARWARRDEVTKAGLLTKEGIVLGRLAKKFLRFGGTEHVLLEAPTRSGKGVGVVIPNLLMWPDSVVVLDVKQENWDLTAGWRAQNGHRTLLFNPLDAQGRTARYNPFGHIDRRDPVEVINELQKISSMLFPQPQSGETFWAEGARTAFLGVAAYVAATIDDGDRALPFTMGEIYRNFAAGDAKKRFPQIIAQREKAGKPLSGGCVSALRDWYMSSDNTFTGLRQSVTAKINLWLNPYVDAATSESDFDLRLFRDQRISLYLGVSPDDLDRIAPIYNLLFQQLIDLNVRELPSKGRHGVKLLLLLDEFARLGRASVIASGFSYVAGYGIRLLPVIQSRSQLREVYGKEVSDEIAANCGLELVFRPKEFAVAKEVSERLGSYTFKAQSRSMGRGGTSTSVSDQRRPLLLPQELMLIPEEDVIVLRSGVLPVRGRKIFYYRDKTMSAQTRTATPPIAVVKVDPTIAQRSLAVIASAEGETPASQAGELVPEVLAAAESAEAGEEVRAMFTQIVSSQMNSAHTDAVLQDFKSRHAA